MKILSLDISSTACGWAILTSWPPKVVDFGVIRPKSKLPPCDRMMVMAREVERIGSGGCFDAVVVEWSDGKVTRPVGKSARGTPILPTGLVTLGQAQGYVVGWLECHGWPVFLVHQNLWTRRVPKEKRAKRLELTCPEYAGRKVKDAGRDIADAIGMGVWFLEQERTRQLAG